jgi:hypothetical protein
MPVSRLASESDIQGTDILITDTATLIRTTGTTDRTTMVGRHFIGLTDTECITRVRIVTTATSGKINGKSSLKLAGSISRQLLFFWRA